MDATLKCKESCNLQMVIIKYVHLICVFQRYKAAGQDTIILAGAEYGSGSSRDWAAKGPMLLVSFLIFLFGNF